MKIYDGNMDPKEHVAQYKERMKTVLIPNILRRLICGRVLVQHLMEEQKK